MVIIYMVVSSTVTSLFFLGHKIADASIFFKGHC